MERADERGGRMDFEDQSCDTYIKNLSARGNEELISCIFSSMTLNDILVKKEHAENSLDRIIRKIQPLARS